MKFLETLALLYYVTVCEHTDIMVSWSGCINTHNEEDEDPRETLIVSTGNFKQRKTSKHNHNIDETRTH